MNRINRGDNANNGPLLTKTPLLYCLTAGGTNGSPRLIAFALSREE